MPFPESPRVIYRNNPLTQVVAQLNFPPILAIQAGQLAEFQECIRDAYPIYRKDGLASLEMPPAIAELLQRLPSGPIAFPSRHVFATESGSQSVALAQDSMSLDVRDYERREPFFAALHRARAALEKIYKPAFYSRVGLRYVDVIDRRKLNLAAVPWTELINEKLVGVFADENVRNDVQELISSAQIAVSGVPGGAVRLQFGPAARDDRPPGASDVYVVDADFFTNAKAACDGVAGILERFNVIAGHLFRWSIRERLHTALDPDPVG